MIYKMSEFRAKKNKSPGGFGERLRALRVQQEMSQADLAKKVGIHVSHVSRYENGLSQPTADNIRKISEILNISGDYLISGKNKFALSADFDDADLIKLFKEVEKLDKRKKEIVKELIQAFVNNDSVEHIIKR